MTQSLFVGVDGGATKCIVRVEDAAGHLLGRATSGPANIRLSVPQAWESINTALQGILKSLSLSQSSNLELHAGMGLAGCELEEVRDLFLNTPHEFSTLTVTSDAHTACLGAHGGKDGAIIIAGTGVVGFQVEQNQTSKVSGWGFPHDDLGSGAWLGLEAAKITSQTLDGRCAANAISKAVLKHFSDQPNLFINFVNQATSTHFAELAPIVIRAAEQQDPLAVSLLQQAAHELDRIAKALTAKQSTSELLPYAILGGISQFLVPFLSESLRVRLSEPLATADAGAIYLIRKSA